ncbi:MAG: hypothetical protein D6692_06365 [Planctomycetota bacterium]|nr:MAG: hypothetical protein D6692_06365 [Planctomycetota bacterium]
MDESLVVVARVRGDAEANEVLYGLSLRGIRAQLRPSVRGGPDPWEVVVPSHSAQQARMSLAVIWDAVLNFDRALTPDGQCPFCGYDQRGVPRDRPCPECGVDLRSVEARRAYRDGRRPEEG